MRILLLVLLILSEAEANPPVPMSIPVSHIRGVAHICPIGDHEALTARHVATVPVSPVNPLELGVSLIRFGNTGVATTTQWSAILDIARLETNEKLPYHFPIANEPVKIGDKVRITGYNQEDGFLQVSKEARVLNIQAGLLIYNNTPGNGSSGSCVFNSNGEVVGVNFGFWDGFRRIGLGVNLTPELLAGLRQ